MKTLWLTALVLSPAIFYGILLLFVALYRGRCPRCHRRELRHVGGYLWDGRNEQGVRSGGLVSFYLCRHCSAQLREANRVWSDASDEDWRQHVTRAI
jgi:hypothetical protein